MKTNSKVAIALVAGAALGGAAIQGLHAQAKAPGYVVVEIDVSNAEGYNKEFLPLGGKALADSGAKFLARGGKAVAIYGVPPKSRTVIVAFDSLEKAQAAYTSPAYMEARKIGDKYATFRICATEGLAQ
jgi:uncharacterized protein (DUF1330 family)